MNARAGARLAVVAGVVALAVIACVEETTSPTSCPDFCPSEQIVTVESLLTTAISRDSSFAGYYTEQDAPVMFAATLPQVDSRPFFRTAPIPLRLRIRPSAQDDTTTGPIVVDSIRLTLRLLRRDTAAHNLRLAFFRLPADVDSNATFDTLAAAFPAAPVRIVNLDSLLHLPGRRDSVTRDTVLSVDSVRNMATVAFMFDTIQVPFVIDTGRLAFGLRVTADARASLAVGASDVGEGPVIVWFSSVDSAGTLVKRDSIVRRVEFDRFVFDPPPAALDSNLTVGSVPATRALLRFAIPPGVRDSTQIIRATLLLVPAGPASGVPIDSFFLRLNRVATDLGLKSPIVLDTFAALSKVLSPGTTDTVRIEMTKLVRGWQIDTTAATAAFLSLLTLDRRDTLSLFGFEGAALTRMQLYSSHTPAFRPALHVTYIRRFRFGVP